MRLLRGELFRSRAARRKSCLPDDIVFLRVRGIASESLAISSENQDAYYYEASFFFFKQEQFISKKKNQQNTNKHPTGKPL